jgi:hypothetical protein
LPFEFIGTFLPVSFRTQTGVTMGRTPGIVSLVSADQEPSSEPLRELADAEPAPSTGAPSMDGKKRPLTPEEQMALYEESLKEDDWGHQPC